METKKKLQLEQVVQTADTLLLLFCQYCFETSEANRGI